MSDSAVNDQAQATVATKSVQTTNATEEIAPAVPNADIIEDTAGKPAQEKPAQEKPAEEKPTEEATAVANEPENGKADEAPKANGHNGQKPAFKKNIKFDPSTQPVTDDPVKIRSQVEFYFSNSNLPTDKFMWETTGGEENKPVSLKTICKFKRMQQFQPYSAVVAALRESKLLDIEGEEGEEVVKRKTAYVKSGDAQKARFVASIYAKGFGEEEPTTQFDLETFFAKYGKVNVVKLRRTADNTFKGSVFVEFADQEQAVAFTKLDPAPTWKDKPLEIMLKKDYVDMKNKQIKEGLIEPSMSRPNRFFEGKDRNAVARGRCRGGRGGHQEGKDDWKKRRDNDQRNGFRGGRGRGGRGRGGRGRGGRDGRDRDSKDKTEVKTQEAPKSTNNAQIPTIQATTDKGTPVKAGKRARETDGENTPPAKKVDTKSD